MSGFWWWGGSKKEKKTSTHSDEEMDPRTILKEVKANYMTVSEDIDGETRHTDVLYIPLEDFFEQCGTVPCTCSEARGEFIGDSSEVNLDIGRLLKCKHCDKLFTLNPACKVNGEDVIRQLTTYEHNSVYCEVSRLRNEDAYHERTKRTREFVSKRKPITSKSKHRYASRGWLK